MWQGLGVQGEGLACVVGAYIVGVGRGHTWQEKRQLQQAVCILLECILVLRLKSPGQTSIYSFFKYDVTHMSKYQGVKEFHMLARIGSL